MYCGQTWHEGTGRNVWRVAKIVTGDGNNQLYSAQYEIPGCFSDCSRIRVYGKCQELLYRFAKILSHEVGVLKVYYLLS